MAFSFSLGVCFSVFLPAPAPLVPTPYSPGSAGNTDLKSVQALHQPVAGLQGLVSRVPQGTADAHSVVVPQIAANLANDHGNRIGGKAYVLTHVEVVDGLDEADY